MWVIKYMNVKRVVRCILLLSIGIIAFQEDAWCTENLSLPLDAHMTDIYQDDLPVLMQKKYIRVLTTVNRTNFFILDGKLAGYEYALLKAYEKSLNKKFNRRELRVVLEFIPVARDQLIPMLTKGYGDIAAAGLTITDDRKKKASFTKPYLTGINEVVISQKEGFYPKDLNDLSKKKIYVRKSSSYYQSLLALNQRFRKEKIKPVKIVPIGEDIETEGILEMVNSGAIGLTVADSHIANAWSPVLKNIKIHENVVLRSGSKLGWMVRKDNPKLLSSLNEFVNTHKKGTLYGNIYFKRYYEDSEMLKNPLQIDEGEKIRQYKEIIKKYAKQYDFDWLLILAQAFQESGLDHTRKSNAGAVGIMQILPSTARDKKIGISNVDKLENNIHAGVKYLAFLRDHYFAGEEISPRDQVRMSLAAYNSGPAKIQKARRHAAKIGLDKNRWFRNVELAALQVIGQEPVRYVSNINKYYVLYQTLTEE